MTDHISPDTLRMERLLDAPIEKVWQYLVDPKLRARWFMGGVTEGHVGGRIQMRMHHDQLSDRPVATPAKYQPHIGQSWDERITQWQPPHRLGITWDGGEAGDVLFELSEVDGKTRLVLTHTGLRGRDDALDFGTGWHSHLAALERRVQGLGVDSYWALHDAAESIIAKALG